MTQFSATSPVRPAMMQDGKSPGGNRIEWLDVARGLTIILVVIGHVERGLVKSHVAQGATWKWMDYTIYTFHMPAFFLFAGLTAAMSLHRKTKAAFLKDKLWTIVYPYFLWSVIQGFVMYALSSLTNAKESLHDIAVIGWQPIGQFWFLYVLMIYQIIGAFMFLQPRLLLVLSALLYGAAAMLSMPDLVHNICHFMIFYTLGFFDLAGIIAFIRSRHLSLIPIFFLCFAIVTYFSGMHDRTSFYSVLALPSTGFGVGLILAISLSTNKQLVSIFTALGAATMTIYMLHILFAAGSRIVLKIAHLPQNAFLYLLICSAAGVVGSFIAHQLFVRYGLLTPLGLASWRRAPKLQQKPA